MNQQNLADFTWNYEATTRIYSLRVRTERSSASITTTVTGPADLQEAV